MPLIVDIGTNYQAFLAGGLLGDSCQYFIKTGEGFYYSGIQPQSLSGYTVSGIFRNPLSQKDLMNRPDLFKEKVSYVHIWANAFDTALPTTLSGYVPKVGDKILTETATGRPAVFSVEEVAALDYDGLYSNTSQRFKCLVRQMT